jgi:hypothetical protein
MTSGRWGGWLGNHTSLRRERWFPTSENPDVGHPALSPAWRGTAGPSTARPLAASLRMTSGRGGWLGSSRAQIRGVGCLGLCAMRRLQVPPLREPLVRFGRDDIWEVGWLVGESHVSKTREVVSHVRKSGRGAPGVISGLEGNSRSFDYASLRPASLRMTSVEDECRVPRLKRETLGTRDVLGKGASSLLVQR